MFCISSILRVMGKNNWNSFFCTQFYASVRVCVCADQRGSKEERERCYKAAGKIHIKRGRRAVCGRICGKRASYWRIKRITESIG